MPITPKTPAIPTRPFDPSVAPWPLPGKGLAQHDFFYAGENKAQNMYIVRGGKIVWRYEGPVDQGEISDAVLLPDGNVLFAHQFGVTLISSDKTVLWRRQAPQGTEVHTAVLLDAAHVAYVQNGNPAEVIVVHVPTDQTVRRFTIPTRYPESVHTQFRQARLTDSGTLLVAHWDLGQVREYDDAGRTLSIVDTPAVWSASRLKNGNLLYCAARWARELDPLGKIVWEFTPADVPGYRVTEFQTAVRLPSGNTLINNWVNPWYETPSQATAPVQAWEVTPDKQVKWALHAWSEPENLGPATIIQILHDA